MVAFTVVTKPKGPIRTETATHRPVPSQITLSCVTSGPGYRPPMAWRYIGNPRVQGSALPPLPATRAPC